MAKAKHTPGPWLANPELGEIFYDDGDVDPIIASVNYDSTSEEQAVADLHLIAAAPDMLEALRGILSNPGSRCTAEQWQAGLRAIAKAEGRT